VRIFGRQFGRPSGPIGGLVGKLMARGNAPFNTALVHRLHQLYPDPTRIVEVGCGPGTGWLTICVPVAFLNLFLSLAAT